MSLNSLIISTLKPTNVPVYPLDYPGSATTYITFFQYNEMGVLYLEDVEDKTQYSYQVDIWSQGNYTSLVKRVFELMTAAGFRRNSGAEFYEKDTKMNHKVFRFYYDNTLGGI